VGVVSDVFCNMWVTSSIIWPGVCNSASRWRSAAAHRTAY